MPSYRVNLSALAVVRGCLVIEDAASVEEAAEMAKKAVGDVSWRYDGTQDDSIEVDSCELND